MGEKEERAGVHIHNTVEQTKPKACLNLCVSKWLYQRTLSHTLSYASALVKQKYEIILKFRNERKKKNVSK
jgi:phage replication-related protein YjqB (UPF0714/DUF867 family)